MFATRGFPTFIATAARNGVREWRPSCVEEEIRMAVEGFAPFPRIVEHVKELCAQGRTGTLFLVSEDNRMALMRFEAGAIVTIVHRNRRGLEALAAVCEIKSAKLRFDVASVAPIDTHDLATKDILDHLEKVARQMPSPAASPDIPRPASFSPEVKLAVQKIMMKYVGPMAEIVCDEHFSVATDARMLARLLAGEIPNPEQSARFLAEIGAVLG